MGEGDHCQKGHSSFLDYHLPPELIAQTPIEPRDAARLLLVDRREASLRDRVFSELPDLLSSGDLLIVNDSRVIPARLQCRRRTGAAVELLFLEETDDNRWKAMARPLGRLQPDEQLEILTTNGCASGEIVRFIRRCDNLALVEVPDAATLDRHGHVPLPPYIRERLTDGERYQTVYSTSRGSAAAPTAGLHFTPELIERCRSAGIQFWPVTLHVGLDTFKPLDEGDPSSHVMHSEWYEVPEETAGAIREAKSKGKRIVSVGTTATRVLETLAEESLDDWRLAGRTSKFIRPPYEFKLVGAQITNFHLPHTTLLLMIGAFAGTGLMRRAYEHAIANEYRFYSFGDAMLIV